ncbi:MAG: hypothetical protein AAF802_19655 [Planctomycetota bacterium]
MIMHSFGSALTVKQPQLGVFKPSSGRWLITRSDDSGCASCFGRERQFLQVGSGTWETEERATKFSTREDAAFYAAEIGRVGDVTLSIVFRDQKDGLG